MAKQKSDPSPVDMRVLDAWANLLEKKGEPGTAREIGKVAKRAHTAILQSLSQLDRKGLTLPPKPRTLTAKGRYWLARWRKGEMD